MDKLLFVHIPKTAGTSLRLFLESQVGGNVYPDAQELAADGRIYQHWPLFVAKFRSARLVRGHLPYHQLITLYSHKPFTMTVLRHPLRRAISELLHHKRLGTEGTKALSLDEMVLSHREYYKPQWHYLGATPDAALANLAQFDWVGVQEHFEGGLQQLTRLLGCPMPARPPKVNATPPVEAALSLKALDALMEAAHDDFRLYYVALERFRKDT
jgi:hypothetical protein